MAQQVAVSASGFRMAVPPLHLVWSEILSVTSAMRKNSRWASSQPGPPRATNLATSMGLRTPTGTGDTAGRPGHDRQEAGLMAGFDELKRNINDTNEILSIPLPVVLAPFLALIRSPLSTGPITATALAAIHNFFTAGLINEHSKDTQRALGELSNSLAHCKFEATDSSGDEVVLMRIVNVIDTCQASVVGNLLGDVELCEMLETILTICCQMRLSESLRRCAETAMHSMVRRVFSKLDNLDPALDNESVEAQASTPYGLPSAQELLRVLVNLLDPHDMQHSDSIRLSILGILNAGLEASGTRIAQFNSLSKMLLDQGCKYLFQLARSENVNVVRLSLRAIVTLFDTMREDLKLQFELFISFTMDRLAPPVNPLPPKVQLSLNTGTLRKVPSSPGTPRPDGQGSGSVDLSDPSSLTDGLLGDQTPPTPRPGVVPAKGLTRELMLETLAYIARQPTFMVDLWANYDCDVNCEDLFERLISFMARGVYPTQYTGSIEYQRYSSQLLCLDVLLAYVEHMAARADADKPQPEALVESKASKGLLLAGAAKFNTKPKVGLAYLEEHGLIYKPEDKDVPRARALAKFLKSTPRLDKKVLGDWISAPDQIDVLKEFIGLFDFTGKSVADAMRLLLEAFRLPGEAQPISRITETFADIYFASKPLEVKSTDAVYVLAYSVIMLNTDLYNPQNRKRMTLEDYQKNLKGVNDGSDFDPAYLKSIYESIKKREIVLPEEHSGQLGFEYAWKALLVRTKETGSLVRCETALFDQSMFQLTWKPVVSAIAFAFTAFDDDYVVERAIAGFRKCATLAGRFQLPEVFDYVVNSLSHATGLLAEEDPKSTKFPVVEVEGQSLTVSPLSVRFGTNLRGQLATVVLFTIANGNGNAIREGWSLIFEMFQTLFMHSLLPPRMIQMEDFLGGVAAIPMQGAAPPSPQMHRSDGGLLSALSSYLLTPYGASTDSLAGWEPTKDDIENTLSTMDCISSCKIDEIYSQIMTLEVEGLVAALRALQVLADRRTVDILVDEIITDPVPSANSRTEVPKAPLPYDPTSVFLLETMVSVACQTKTHIEETWPIVFEHISGLLKAAERFGIILIERAVVGLLRLNLILAEQPSLRDQVYVSIDLLRGLPPIVTNSVAEQLAMGLARLVKEHYDIMSSATEWGLVSALLRSTMSHAGAVKISFALIMDLIERESEQAVTPENIAALTSLLETFASAAGQAVEGKRSEARRQMATPLNLEPAIERGTKAIDTIADLKKYIPSFIERSTLSESEAWSHFWMLPLGVLSRQSSSACKEVRHASLGHLQRIFLSTQISAGVQAGFEFRILFDRVLFPILEEVLKPQVYVKDPPGMGEARLRVSALACKSFLHFSVRSTEGAGDTLELWLSLLKMMDRVMHSGKRDQAYEAIPESLKNVVLVLNASQVLLPPDHPDSRTPAQIQYWDSTKQQLDAFLPGFLEELVPSPPPPPADAPDTQPASAPS
ncbi:GDP/GTP exchange factor for ARF [Tulasnella sp. UAMH 9824]|nr:GDP/GTP exchange factor for ARF [Tulasnella sp. UAMH 9824]